MTTSAAMFWWLLVTSYPVIVMTSIYSPDIPDYSNSYLLSGYLDSNNPAAAIAYQSLLIYFAFVCHRLVLCCSGFLSIVISRYMCV